MSADDLKCPKCEGPAVRILQSGEVHCSNQCDETDPDTARRLEFQAMTSTVASALGSILPSGVGFILILAPFGEKAGALAYASNMEREGTISTLKELADKMSHDQAVADHVVNTTIAKAVSGAKQ